jgi:hydrogenase expression/formation protein HypC
MCLGVPGRVVRWLNRDATFAQAEVEFDGVRRVCHMACTTDAHEGDFVIVHAGIAISRIDEAEAKRALAELQLLNDDDGWHEVPTDETVNHSPSTDADYR